MLCYDLLNCKQLQTCNVVYYAKPNIRTQLTLCIVIKLNRKLNDLTLKQLDRD